MLSRYDTDINSAQELIESKYNENALSIALPPSLAHLCINPPIPILHPLHLLKPSQVQQSNLFSSSQLPLSTKSLKSTPSSPSNPALQNINPHHLPPPPAPVFQCSHHSQSSPHPLLPPALIGPIELGPPAGGLRGGRMWDEETEGELGQISCSSFPRGGRRILSFLFMKLTLPPSLPTYSSSIPSKSPDLTTPFLYLFRNPLLDQDPLGF